MNCEHGLLLLNAQIDNEIPADDGYQLAAHLNECADCQSAAAALEQTDRELSRLFDARPRAAAVVADRALQAWFAEAAAPSRRRMYWVWMSAAAAMIAFSFVVFGPKFWNGAQNDDRDDRARALVQAWQQSAAPSDVELQLRSIGSACGDPLADAVQAWKGAADDERRLDAARVLCDLADNSQIPTLIDLLGDSSTEVQRLSEATLVRLTGRRRSSPLGPDIEAATSCSNAQGDWRAWWAENKAWFEAVAE